KRMRSPVVGVCVALSWAYVRNVSRPTLTVYSPHEHGRRDDGVPSGGHAFGLRRTNDPITGWPLLVETWLRTIGILAMVLAVVRTADLTVYRQSQARAATDMFPQWSPDGRLIAFTSDRDGDPEIYVMRADGSGARRLTHSPGRDAHPFFSPDDRRIVFQSPRANGEDTNIYVMQADGSVVVQLTRLKGFAGVPAFSPDNTLIAFQWRETSNFDDDKKWRICVMRADGSDVRVLTSGEANDQVPNWSPDGTRLIFYSDRTGRNQIYTM